jgi:competence protein ComEC
MTNLIPVIYAALGAAFTYYTLPILSGFLRGPCIVGLFFLMIALVSLSRVLALGLVGITPAESFSPAIFRISHRRILALAAGLILGLTSRSLVDGEPRLGLPRERIRFISGILGEDPRESSGGQAAHRAAGMGYLELRSASNPKGVRATARGRVLVFFPGEVLPRLREFGRGAELYLEGAFTEPTPGSGFNGPRMFRATAVHIVKPAPAQEQLRTGMRQTLLDKFGPYRWGGLAAALILGVKDNLDSELALGYRNAGCAHVLALSGMHLAIVAALAAFFLRKPLGLKPASLAGAALILLYVVLVGVQPSLERSLIMYLLGTAAVLGFLPRQPQARGPMSLLSMAFLIQLILRPSSGDSLSFILSYLALWGILTVGESFRGILRGRLPDFLAQPLAASIGAYLATAAITAASFGMVRPVGLVAGLIIVPLTSVFMIAAMAILVLGFLPAFLPGLAALMGFVDICLSALYGLLNRLVSMAALVPGIPAQGWTRELLVSIFITGLCLFLGNRLIQRRLRLAPFC